MMESARCHSAQPNYLQLSCNADRLIRPRLAARDRTTPFQMRVVFHIILNDTGLAVSKYNYL